tara:strand:- start:199 stop:1137 length:939 start_codon:yes stop_codon:yes gene_type:complete
MKKLEYLFSIPDVISIKEAAPLVAPFFVRASKKDKAKKIGDLTKYVCFHKDLRFGVYKDDDKFFLVLITKPKKVFGIETDTMFQEITEILTDDTTDTHLEKGSITGATLLIKKNDSEKFFLNEIINYDANTIDQEAANLVASIAESSEIPDENDIFKSTEADDILQSEEKIEEAPTEETPEEKKDFLEVVILKDPLIKIILDLKDSEKILSLKELSATPKELGPKLLDLVDLLKECMVTIIDGDNDTKIHVADVSEDEVDQFIDTLSMDQIILIHEALDKALIGSKQETNLNEKNDQNKSENDDEDDLFKDL